MCIHNLNLLLCLWKSSVTVDTACSSSMYALHLAVTALRNGDCDAAIVGGSNLILSPEMQLLTSSLGALSATSKCHTFDASADGYGRGEGFGALYMKKHSAALRERHPIRALIRGTAINSYVTDNVVDLDRLTMEQERSHRRDLTPRSRRTRSAHSSRIHNR